MALSAVFSANFDSFVAAVQKVEAQLKDFDGDANKVAASLTRMGNAFSGVKTIQDAQLVTKAVADVGGVSTLTAKEMARVNDQVTEAIAKYKALGGQAPQSMVDLANATKKTGDATGSFASGLSQANGLLATFGVGLSVGAVVGFGRALLNMGDEIVRVADRTGLTTDEVQKLSYVAGQSGNSIDELTGAIGQMQNRLASGDKSAVQSVKDLHLNFAALVAASPATQMEMIATEIAKIPDPAERTRIAMDLFGKTGTAILPTLTSQFAKLAAEAPKMSEATVRALDTAGDQLSRFGLQIKIWAAESYNYLRSGFDRIIASTYRAIASMSDAAASVVKFASQIPGASAVMKALGTDLNAMTQNAQWFRDAAAGMTPPVEATTTAAKMLAPAMKDVAEHTTKAASAVTKVKDEVEKLLPGQNTWALGIGQLNQRIPDMTQHMLVAAAALRELDDWVAPLASRDLPALNKHIALLPNVLPGATAAIKDATAAVASLGDQIRGGLSAALGNIPTLLSNAFTGGGDLMGAMKAIGVQISTAILQPIIDGLKRAGQLANAAAVAGSAAAATIGAGAVIAGKSWANALGQVGLAATGVAVATGIATAATISAGTAVAGSSAMTAALVAGAWTMGIGAAAVGVALLVRHYLKVSEAEKDARKEFEAYQKNFGTLDEMIDTVGKAYATMGLNGTVAQHDINVALDATHHSAQEVHAALVTINEVMIAAAERNAAIEATNDAFKALMSTVTDVGIGLTDSMQAALSKMLEVPGVTDEIKAAISGLRDSAQPDFAKLEALAKTYGGTIDQLGPKFKQAHVTADASKWITDIEKLVAAGADYNDVLGFMKDEAQAIVLQSKQFDTTIPENMRPYLQSLIESGGLLDENKQAITDIGTLKFGAAVKTDVDKMTDAIKDLAAAIDKIPAKLGDIAGVRLAPIVVPYRYELVGDVPAPGPSESARAAAGLSARGVVLPFIPRVSAPLVAGVRVSARTADGGTARSDFDGLRKSVDQLRKEQLETARDLPRALALAMRAALATSPRRAS